MSQEIKKRHGLRFDRWSNKYDRSILQKILFNRSHDMFFGEVLPLLKKGARVLDVGCGTGKFAFRLSGVTRGVKIHGIDISKEMIDKAKSKLRDEPIEFDVGDVENLPYKSDTFDIITCSNSFHHYPNQKKAVSEMRRVLKKDGKLMIIDGCRDRFLGKIIFGVVQVMEGDVYHIFERELKDMLMSLGFEKISQRKFNPLAPLLFTLGHVRKEDRVK